MNGILPQGERTTAGRSSPLPKRFNDPKQKCQGLTIVRGVFEVTAFPASPYISAVRPPGPSAQPSARPLARPFSSTPLLRLHMIDERYDGVLKDRDAMGRYCAGHPEGGFNDGLEFAFRADTARYSYLIRLNPQKGEENLSVYCYRREWLDRHMEQARKGIRFITPHYEEKFRIPDGDGIRIFTGGGETRDRTARYIDDCHVELVSDHGSNLYHICELAERLERSGGRVIPLRSSLPDKCFSITSAADEIVVITKGEMGHRPAGARAEGVTAREGATALNEAMGVTKAQEAAMLFGSIYGWDKSGADPENYDGQSEPIKFKHRDGEDHS